MFCAIRIFANEANFCSLATERTKLFLIYATLTHMIDTRDMTTLIMLMGMFGTTIGIANRTNFATVIAAVSIAKITFLNS